MKKSYFVLKKISTLIIFVLCSHSLFAQKTLNRDSTFKTTDLPSGTYWTLQKDDKIIAFDRSINSKNNIEWRLHKFNENGDYDKNFGIQGISTIEFVNFALSSGFSEPVIQSDGKILIAGDVMLKKDEINKIHGIYLFRLNSNGSLDLSFNNSGFKIIHNNLYDGSIPLIQISQDEKIILVNSGSKIVDSRFSKDDMMVTKLNKDGSFDLSFNVAGYISYDKAFDHSSNPNWFYYEGPSSISIKPNNEIVIGFARASSLSPSNYELGYYLVSPTGNKVSDYFWENNTQYKFFTPPDKIISLPDNGLLISESKEQNYPYNATRLRKVNSNNSVIFSLQGEISNEIPCAYSSLFINDFYIFNKKIYVAATSYCKAILLRLNEDGTNDKTFNNGKSIYYDSLTEQLTFSGNPKSLFVQQNGRQTGSILVALDFYRNNQWNSGIVRYNYGNIAQTESLPKKFIKIQPNPTTGLVTFGEMVETVWVADIHGKILLTQYFTNQFDMSNFADGVYFVKLKQNNQNLEIQKIIKN
jgi:uncharacterized delta-60 repeat protein